MALRPAFQQSDERSPDRVNRTASGRSKSRGRKGRAEKRAKEGDFRSVEKAIEKDCDVRSKLRSPRPVEEEKTGETVRDASVPARLQISQLDSAIEGHFGEYREKHANKIPVPPKGPPEMREENTRHRGIPKRGWKGE